MTKPNILFIMTDQQHAGMLSCAGNTKLQTPALDRLASEGVRFERAYCTNPVCAPSRVSMATGMMPCRLGADDNAAASKIEHLPAHVVAHSMGNAMKDAGYETFYGGKVHMCRELQPAKAGYDEVFDDDREALPGACLDFIIRERERPFFAVASFINPHDICFAHRAYKGENTHGVLALRQEAESLPLHKLPPLPANYAIPSAEPRIVGEHASMTAITPSGIMRRDYNEREWRINRYIYHRLTEQVDALIGMILDGVKSAGIEDDTVIIFVSDHGNMDASHRLASKFFYYEESVGVPMIMKHKGRIPAGRVDADTLVSTGLDILPTLCDYAERERAPHLLGQTLRPTAEASPDATRPDYIVAECSWFRMLTSGRYKYCAFAADDAEECLVDLDEDPGEMRNLASDPAFTTILQEHRQLLQHWVAQSGDCFPSSA